MAQNNNPSASGDVRGQVDHHCEVVLVYTTFPSLEAAEAMGQSLVRQKLAGCINILPGMVSIYVWEGSLERAQEVVLIAKTAAASADACMAAILQGHPYDTPAILVLPVAAGSAAYVNWILAGSQGGVPSR